MNDKKLPLRIGVGVIVLNNENKVFVGKRKIIQSINGKCLRAALIKMKIFYQQ